MRPKEGFRPKAPQNAAGMRMEPPLSAAVASGTMRAATAAAEPPLLPPEVRARSHGLRVAPNGRFLHSAAEPKTGTLVLPTTMAPAACRRATCTEEAAAGRAPAPVKTAQPCDVGSPATSSRSFTATGTPAIGPSTSPRASAAVCAAATARARAAHTCVKALMLGSRSARRERQASTASVGVSAPRAMRHASSVASRSMGWTAGGAGCPRSKEYAFTATGKPASPVWEYFVVISTFSSPICSGKGARGRGGAAGLGLLREGQAIAAQATHVLGSQVGRQPLRMSREGNGT